MDIGVMIAPTAEAGNIAEIARTVEDLGFESLFIPEHPVIPVDFKTVPPGGGDLPEHYGRWMDPFVALSVAAAVTSRLKLGTGICLLPEREPLITAKAIASLDVISGGRVILGVGGGWLREETEAMGTRFGQRWKRLRETVEALRVLWTQAEPSYEGELVRFPKLRCEPKPIQKGGPPILLGAHGPKAFERVARTYDGWIPLAGKPQSFKNHVEAVRKVVAQAGRDPSTLHINAFVPPGEDGVSLEDLKGYKDAGVQRLVLFSQRDAIKIANGLTLEVIRRIAPTVERARKL
ncbi:MAG TPA: LLM class F420-dependent oxidoreductase [Candidatus Binataceae bacterium]|nr:LLM class F420-dependent oxidoreductase [Candidatus Binataceae bacterium]